ncbi:MAG: preprotein translocase subunit SecG [Rikenellaceae bacterium]
MLYNIIIGLILIACVLLVLAVLVQNPKGGMAANFGASNQVMGVRQTTDFLEKFTWTMAIAILALSLLATVALGSHDSDASSAVSKDSDALFRDQIQSTEAPLPQVEVPAETAPAE